MVPRVGGVAVKASWPEKDLVLVVHTVFVVVLVKVVSGSVVVVVKRRREVLCQLNGVGKAVTVPIVVGPIHDAVVVVVPCGLLFAPETARNQLLVNVQTAVVIIVRVFAIGDAVVVVVNVVNARRAEALRHDSSVPNGLIESITVGVCIVSVIVVVNTVVALEEVAVVLTRIVIKVEVAVNFKVVPNTVVVIVDVEPVEDGVVIIVQINGGIGEVAVNIAVDVVLLQVRTQFIGEVGFGAVVAVPLPDTGRQTDPGDVGVSVVLHLGEGDGGIDVPVTTKVVVPAANSLHGRTAPVA